MIIDADTSTCIAAVSSALLDGQPVVVPLPTPLPYTIAGRDARAVNSAKRRDADQPVGVHVSKFDAVSEYLDLHGDARSFAGWVAEQTTVGLRAPVCGRPPAWLLPAVADGVVFCTCTPWIAQLAPVIDDLGWVYLSSANRTSQLPAVTAGDANDYFDGELLVVDADRHRDFTRPHASSTVVFVDDALAPRVARRGIDDRGWPSGDAFLDEMVRRWATLSSTVHRKPGPDL